MAMFLRYDAICKEEYITVTAAVQRDHLSGKQLASILSPVPAMLSQCHQDLVPA